MAFLIALGTNTAPAVTENYLAWKLKINGMNRIYTECNNCTDAWPPVCTPPELSHVEQSYSGSKVACHGVPDWETDWAKPDTILLFWAFDIPSIVGAPMWLLAGALKGLMDCASPSAGWIVLEMILLGVIALDASCKIASLYNFRLTPVNETRSFVACSFIHATFELGNPTVR